MDIYTKVLIWVFGLAVLLGIISNKTNFCTMGAVSDVVNMGDTGRLRAWLFAVGVAIIGVMLLEYFGFTDMSLTQNNDTSSPPYRTPIFSWPRHLVGGIIFGVGMTLASGCGSKNLIRLGGGNLKSVLVLLVMGFAAYLMIVTDFGHIFFLSWMDPMSIDLNKKGIEHQGLGAIVGYFLDSDSKKTGYIIAAVLGSLMILWALLSSDFFKNYDKVFSGLAIGLIIIVTWWVSAGEMGQSLLEEAEMMDERPYGIGAQSVTFVQSSGHLMMWLKSGFSSIYVTFALVLAAGVVSGSMLYSIMFQKFSIEWFSSWKDFFTHVIGAFFMGVGGVLAGGCTFGQAISGCSTLALGTFITFVAIVFGSAVTMKIEYYNM